MTSGVLVPIEDVAKFFSVSVSTIRVWVRRGLVPDNCYVKIGNTKRFNLEAMEKEFNPAKANKLNDAPKPQPEEMITFEDM